MTRLLSLTGSCPDHSCRREAGWLAGRRHPGAQLAISADAALATCTEPLTVRHCRCRSAPSSWSDATRSLVTRPATEARSRNTPVPGTTLTSMSPETEFRSPRPRARLTTRTRPLAVQTLTEASVVQLGKSQLP